MNSAEALDLAVVYRTAGYNRPQIRTRRGPQWLPVDAPRTLPERFHQWGEILQQGNYAEIDVVSSAFETLGGILKQEGEYERVARMERELRRPGMYTE